MTYVDDGLSENAVDLSSHGGLVLEVGVRANEVLERLVVRIEAAITKSVVEEGLALLLVDPGDTSDVEDGHVLGVSCGKNCVKHGKMEMSRFAHLRQYR